MSIKLKERRCESEIKRRKGRKKHVISIKGGEERGENVMKNFLQSRANKSINTRGCSECKFTKESNIGCHWKNGLVKIMDILQQIYG